jgi:hypothetical protein
VWLVRSHILIRISAGSRVASGRDSLGSPHLLTPPTIYDPFANFKSLSPCHRHHAPREGAHTVPGG